MPRFLGGEVRDVKKKSKHSWLREGDIRQRRKSKKAFGRPAMYDLWVLVGSQRGERSVEKRAPNVKWRKRKSSIVGNSRGVEEEEGVNRAPLREESKLRQVEDWRRAPMEMSSPLDISHIPFRSSVEGDARESCAPQRRGERCK